MRQPILHDRAEVVRLIYDQPGGQGAVDFVEPSINAKNCLFTCCATNIDSDGGQFRICSNISGMSKTCCTNLDGYSDIRIAIGKEWSGQPGDFCSASASPCAAVRSLMISLLHDPQLPVFG